MNRYEYSVQYRYPILIYAICADNDSYSSSFHIWKKFAHYCPVFSKQPIQGWLLFFLLADWLYCLRVEIRKIADVSFSGYAKTVSAVCFNTNEDIFSVVHRKISSKAFLEGGLKQLWIWAIRGWQWSLSPANNPGFTVIKERGEKSF